MKLFNKFLVQRRDGSIPEWPYLVMGAADPIAPLAIRAYAEAARHSGMDSEYCEGLERLAVRFESWRQENWEGDPDAPAHRKDNPGIVAMIPPYATANPTEE